MRGDLPAGAARGPRPAWNVARVFTRGYGGLWTFKGHETVSPGDSLSSVRTRVAGAENVRAADVRVELIRLGMTSGAKAPAPAPAPPPARPVSVEPVTSRKTDDELYETLCRAEGRRVILIYRFNDPADPHREFYERFRLPGDREITFREAVLIALERRGIKP